MASRLLLVALGGAAGAVLRALVGGWVARLAAGSLFPWGTLVVNVAGCFALGALQGATEGRGLAP